MDESNSKGWTPLFYLYGAIGIPQTAPSHRTHQTSIEYLRFLSSNSFQEVNAQDSLGWTCMHRAAIHGTGEDIVDLLSIDSSPFVKTKLLQWSPIWMAVYNSNFSTFQALAKVQSEYFMETDIQAWTLLHIAAGTGNKQIIDRLLKDGADVHATTDSRASVVPEALKGRSVTPLEVALATGTDVSVAFLEVLECHDSEVVVIDSEDGKDIFFLANDI